MKLLGGKWALSNKRTTKSLNNHVPPTLGRRNVISIMVEKEISKSQLTIRMDFIAKDSELNSFKKRVLIKMLHMF